MEATWAGSYTHRITVTVLSRKTRKGRTCRKFPHLLDQFEILFCILYQYKDNEKN